MANEEQLSILRQGVEVWNKWREENLDVTIDLSNAELEYKDLRGADLSQVILNNAIFNRAQLSHMNFIGAKLRGASFFQASLYGTNFENADLSNAYLSQAMLVGANLFNADLSGANLSGADLSGVDLKETIVKAVDLGDANLLGGNLAGVNLQGNTVRGAKFALADLSGVKLSGEDLTGAEFSFANLSGANFSRANLAGADFSYANLGGANMTDAKLVGTNFLGAKIHKTRISGSSVYGINIWDLEGEFEEQKDLIITREREPVITVDNIEVAQFIYLILHNEKIRDVINTLTSKSVLILGRFAIPERKEILDALRNKLREYNLLPIVFDFDRPTDKDFTETIKTLASISYFVIADVTNPKSSPLELQATVPDYQIPFVPIIQEGESPFAMMVDLQKKYPWVLPTRSYDSIETLMAALKPGIIDPAVEMRNKLRLVKAQEQVTESLRDYVDKTL